MQKKYTEGNREKFTVSKKTSFLRRPRISAIASVNASLACPLCGGAAIATSISVSLISERVTA